MSFFSFYSIAINASLAPLVIADKVVVTDAATVVAVAVVVDDDDDDDDNDNVQLVAAVVRLSDFIRF